MKQFLRVIGLFCFIYNPPVASFNLIHVLAAMAIMYIVSSPSARRLLADIYDKSKCLILAYVICAGVCLLNGTPQTLLNFFAVLIEIIPISVAIVSIYKKQYQQLLNDIVWASSLQAFISLVTFLVPSLQAIIIARMVAVGYSDIFDFMAGWRMYGLSRELTFAMPITQSIIASICLYFGLLKNKKYFIPIPFLVFSSIINARTGMVVFALGFIIVLLSVYRFKISSMLYLILGIPIVLFVFSLFSALLSRNELTTDWLMAGFDDINSFARGEELDEKGSYFITATDASKYKVPDSFSQLLFGTGERLQGSNRRYKTDIGLINDIWTGGLVYLILVWCFFLSKTVKIVECDARLRRIKRANLLALGVVAILMITNIKGQVFTWNEFVNFWFILFTIHISRISTGRNNNILKNL